MKKILLVAGEVSADHHGADLLAFLKREVPQLECTGIGGDLLEASGMEVRHHLRDMAFLGLIEVIKHLPFIRKVHNDLVKWAEDNRPDAAILIDYPGFNLRLARSLNSMGIPVIYYISPQLWAWGRGRVEKIRKYVDLMLVLFPFEKKFYEQHGVEAVYVGHPMVDKHLDRLPSIDKVINPDKITVGILPGSRTQEVDFLLPRMIESVRLLGKEKKALKAEIVKVSHIPESVYRAQMDQGDTMIDLVESDLNQRLPVYDAVISASGTATLESGFFAVPTLVVYHVNALTYWLGRVLVKIKNIGLINIVAEKQVAPELIQHEFTPSAAARILRTMLEPEENKRIRKELHIIREKLGDPGASRRAAEAIHMFLDKMVKRS